MWSSCPWVMTTASMSSTRSSTRRRVRQDQIDARLAVLGEQHPAVDDQQPAVVLVDGHVPTDLADAAQRDDAQRPRRAAAVAAQLGRVRVLRSG